MNLEIKKYLFDNQESIDSIEKYLGDKRDFNVYVSTKCCAELLSANLRL